MSENPVIAIVGLGAILPDAPDVQTFWKNIQASRIRSPMYLQTAGKRNFSTIPIHLLLT